MALPAALDFIGASVTEGLFKTAMLDLITYLETLEAIPVGTVNLFPVNAVPARHLKANGAAVSRTTYAALFAVIGTTYGAGDGSTTFNLPDYRGYFPRAWDDGRGVDPGRLLGTVQADQNLSHTHTTDSQGSHNHSISTGSGTGGQTAINMLTGHGSVTLTLGGHVSTAGAHAHNVVASGGGEARPKNMAFLLCIKY